LFRKLDVSRHPKTTPQKTTSEKNIVNLTL